MPSLLALAALALPVMGNPLPPLAPRSALSPPACSLLGAVVTAVGQQSAVTTYCASYLSISTTTTTTTPTSTITSIQYVGYPTQCFTSTTSPTAAASAAGTTLVVAAASPAQTTTATATATRKKPAALAALAKSALSSACSCFSIPTPTATVTAATVTTTVTQPVTLPSGGQFQIVASDTSPDYQGTYATSQFNSKSAATINFLGSTVDGGDFFLLDESCRLADARGAASGDHAAQVLVVDPSLVYLSASEDIGPLAAYLPCTVDQSNVLHCQGGRGTVNSISTDSSKSGTGLLNGWNMGSKPTSPGVTFVPLIAP